MVDEPPVHTFDESRALVYRPNDAHTKTAILVDVVDDATTEVNTAFGVQCLRGPFYIVSERNGSYGAAKEEFERSHRSAGHNSWVKNASVQAYRSGERCIVETFIGRHLEATVVAEPDDWIVRQASGEVMVLDDHEFAARYVVDDGPLV